MTNCRRLLYCCIILLTYTTTNAKRQELDSMLNVAQTAKSNALKAEALNRVAFMQRDILLDSALIYSTQATQIAANAGNDTIWARAYVIKCMIYDELGDLDEALICADSAIILAEKIKYPDMLYSCFTAKAKILRFKNELALALTYYLKALEQAEISQKNTLIAKSYTNLGVYYVTRKDLGLAEEYHLKALALRKNEGQTPELSTCYENLGILNREKGDYKKALEYYNKGLEINIILNDSSGIAYSYNDIGAAYSFIGEYEKAQKYLVSSISIRNRIQDISELAYTLNYLGENYERKGEFKLAEYYLKEALRIATKNSFNKQKRESLESISDFYERNKMYDSAFKYSKLHRLFKDSLLKNDNEERIARLTTKFQTLKKEKLITEQQSALNKRNYLIWGLSLLIFSIVIATLSLYQRYKQKQSKKLQQAILLQQDLATKGILEAEEKERQRIAADLHDGIGQLLTAARLNLEGLKSKISLQTESDKATYQKAFLLVDESCKEVRNVSHNIMPNSLIKFGLGNAVKDFIEKIESKQLSINLNIIGLNEKLDPNVELIVYRVIQEAINNVIKHSKANQLDLSIQRDSEGLSISIEDNGIGFNKSELQKKEGGIGMKNILARVEFLKGELDIDTKPGKGTLIAIHIPLETKTSYPNR